jgi:ketosteroid isomerase-like protein
MSADNVQVLRDAYDAFARQDIPSVLQAFDEDISWTTPDSLPFGGTVQGHGGVLGFFGALGERFEFLSVEPQEFIDGGDTIVTIVRDRTRTMAGVSVETEAVHLWRMRDGKAVSFTEYVDATRMLQALGAEAGAAT